MDVANNFVGESEAPLSQSMNTKIWKLYVTTLDECKQKKFKKR